MNTTKTVTVTVTRALSAMDTYWRDVETASEALRIASLTGTDNGEIRRLERVLRVAQNALFAAAQREAESDRVAN